MDLQSHLMNSYSIEEIPFKVLESISEELKNLLLITKNNKLNNDIHFRNDTIPKMN